MARSSRHNLHKWLWLVAATRAPVAYGPHDTLYNRWKRWSDKGIFARMVAGLAAGHGEDRTVMTDAPCLKARRTATGMGVKRGGGRGRLTGPATGGANIRLHAVRDSQGQPLGLFLTASQVSDCIGVRALPGSLPEADWPPGDRVWRGPVQTSIEKQRDTRTYPWPKAAQEKPSVTTGADTNNATGQRSCSAGSRVGRRVATGYDKCPKVFLSALALAVLVIYWL